MAYDPEEFKRLNPKAVQQLDAMKDVITALGDLRRAGVARGPEAPPPSNRTSLPTPKPRGIVKGGSKLTFRA